MNQMREDAGAELARTLRRVALAAFCLLGVGLFLLWRIDNPRIERLRMALADAVAPSMDMIAGPVARAGDLLRDWERFGDVYAENHELRREIERLRAWREAARSLERENAQLRALNNVRLSARMGFATGEVIADAGGPFGRSVLVNIGARDGVVDGAAAMDGAGLVGRVVGVGEEVSRVLLLTDFDSRVPVKVLPSGVRGVLTGEADAPPRLRFVGDLDAVSPGQRVVTSGDGGVFPPDLVVGVVAAMDRRGALAQLASDYRGLSFLRILRWRRPAPADAPGELVLPAPQGPPMLGQAP